MSRPHGRFQNNPPMMGRGPPMRGGRPPFHHRAPDGRGPPPRGGGRFMGGGRISPGRHDMRGGGFNGMRGMPPRGGMMNHRGPPPPPPPPHIGQARGTPPPPPPPSHRGGPMRPPMHRRPMDNRGPPPRFGDGRAVQPIHPPGGFGRPPQPPMTNGRGGPMVGVVPPHHPVTQPLTGAIPPPPARPAPQIYTNVQLPPQHIGAPGMNNRPAVGASFAAPLPAPASIWSEHTAPNGSKFYYNSVTKKSIYDKPPELGGVPVPQQTPAPKPWVEYTDASTGKKYYSNGTTTTWEKPAALNALVSSSTTSVAVESANEDTPEQPRKRQKSKRATTEFSSKEEAIAAFKGLLIAKDVAPSLKWNELAKQYSSDSRWEACEDVLTTGERKQALAEYQTKRANELRRIERQEKARAREAFTELLTEVLPKTKIFSAWNTRFEDIRDLLARDDRFHVVADEATRESLFLDFCEEFRKREERKKRNMRREVQDNFKLFLQEMEEGGKLTFASTWNSFLASLDESTKADSRFATSSLLTDSDRQLYFADFVIELQAAEDDKRRRIRDARRRAEQAQRDAFRDFLQGLARNGGKLLPWSRWRELEEIIVTDASYSPMREQGPEAPRDLFEDFVNEWHQRYRRDRVLLGKLIRPTSQTQLVVNADTSYETFAKALLDSASVSPELFSDAKMIINRSDPISSARVYFDEMRSKGPPTRTAGRRGSALRRGNDDDSSEDEGEIKEDGEVDDEKTTEILGESRPGNPPLEEDV